MTPIQITVVFICIFVVLIPPNAMAIEDQDSNDLYIEVTSKLGEQVNRIDEAYRKLAQAIRFFRENQSVLHNLILTLEKEDGSLFNEKTYEKFYENLNDGCVQLDDVIMNLNNALFYLREFAVKVEAEKRNLVENTKKNEILTKVLGEQQQDFDNAFRLVIKQAKRTTLKGIFIGFFLGFASSFASAMVWDSYKKCLRPYVFNKNMTKSTHL
jgi:hypothetical protein